VKIPGDALVEISVWDWDGIGDDLIGSTTIDIEDRWFTKEWRAMPLFPVEFRTLKRCARTSRYAPLAPHLTDGRQPHVPGAPGQAGAVDGAPLRGRRQEGARGSRRGGWLPSCPR
jgi:hypothetical protein